MSNLTTCPHCGARFVGVPERVVGTTAPCRRCGRPFEVVLSSGAPAQPGSKPPPATRIEVREGSAGQEPPPATRIDGGVAPTAVPGPTLVDKNIPSPAHEPGVIPATAVEPVFSATTTTAVKAADEWQPGEIILDLYEVAEILGTGGMGQVYRVHHRGWGVDLAVKRPLPALLASPGGAEAFEREAETWINLGLHPHIVSCFYVRRVRETPHVFAEFVAGGSLHQWIRDLRLLEIDRILDVAIQIAWALHYAHEQGLVHQDVKPANIMLTPDGQAKITDFGLARAGAVAAIPAPLSFADGTNSVMVSSGGMTPAYCSPEQLSGASLTRRTDIWSWAVTLFEIFVGDVIWRSGAVAPRILVEYLQSGSQHERIANMPDAVVDLLNRCWQQDPSERPCTMLAVAEELVSIYAHLVGREYHRRRPRAGRDTADSLNNRAVSLLDLGCTDEAEQLWRQAESRQAHHIETTYNSVIHAWRTGEMTDEEVIHRMQELRRTETESVRDEHLLGKIYLALADYPQALACLDDALATEPDNNEIIRDLSLARCSLAAQTDTMEGWQTARAELQVTAATFAHDPTVVTALAEAIRATGEEAEARRLYGDARAHNNTLPSELADAVTAYLPRAALVHRWREFSGPAKGSALSRNARLAAAVGDGHLLVAWNTVDGVQVLRLADRSRTAIALALSPDGTTAVVASEREPLAVWDMAAGARIGNLQPHQGAISNLCFSDDGRTVLGGSSDRRVRLWDLESRSLKRELEGHTGAVTAVHASEDCEVVVSGSIDRDLRVWQASSGACTVVLGGHQGTVRGVAVSSDGSLAVSGADDGTVRVWDLVRGVCSRVLRGHCKPVSAVCLAADRSWALSAATDGSIRQWDLASGSPSVLTRFDTAVTNLQLAADGSLALVSTGTTTCLFKPFAQRSYNLPYALSVPVSSEQAEERAAAYDRLLLEARNFYRGGELGDALACLRQARTVRGFERATDGVALWKEVVQLFPRRSLLAAWERTSHERLGAPLTSVAVDEDGGRAAFGLADGRVGTLDLRASAEPQISEMHDKLVSSVAFGDDGDLAASSSWDEKILLWKTDTLKVVNSHTGHTDYVLATTFIPGGRQLLSTGSDGTARIWHLGSEGVSEILDTRETSIAACAVSPDGCYAVTAGWDQQLRLWDLDRRRLLAELEGHEQPITAVEISPDGGLALSAGIDRALRLWDLRKDRCLRTLRGHGDEITAVKFTPDGRFAASACKDGTVRLWDLRENRCLRTFEGHTGAVTALAFSDGGSTLVTGGNDASLRLWHLDWDPEERSGSQWDERARPYLELFLHRRLERDPLPIESNQVVLGKRDLLWLRHDLARRGFGWISARQVRDRLQELANSWRGATTTWNEIRSAERKHPRRGRGARKPGLVSARAAVATAATLLLLSIVVVTMVVMVRVKVDSQRVEMARRQTEAAMDPDFVPGLMRQCQEADRELYLAWSLDPMEANPVTISCLARVADSRSVTGLLDRLRELHRKAGTNPHQALQDQTTRYIDLGAAGGSQPIFTVGSELIRVRRLCLTIFTHLRAEEAEILPDYLEDNNPVLRSVTAEALACRGDRPSAAALVAASRSDEAELRITVAGVLPQLIASNVLSGRRSFALVARLCSDERAETRALATGALVYFNDQRALRRARALCSDPDSQTARAAEAAVAEIKEALQP